MMKSRPGFLKILLLVAVALRLLAGCAGSGGKDEPRAGPPLGDELGGDDSWIQPVFPISTTAGSESASAGGWAIVLRTYSRHQYLQRANAALLQMRSYSPLLADARIERTADGAAVVYGRYESAADAAAQRDLKQIKSITVNSSKIFERSYMTYLEPPVKKPSSRYDLMVLRQKYPKVDPLYSLQVAAWSDFGSGKMTWDEVQSRAEKYCSELRNQGLDAYVHHNRASGISVVTVGEFDRTAIDAKSGIESSDLINLRRRFHEHLVNGEPLEEPIPGRYDRNGKVLTRTQRPRLVEVPK